MKLSILHRHYQNYIDLLTQNNKELISETLSKLEIKNLFDQKYNLTEFDIYKYITALDHIRNSLGCYKINLTEGITSNKNKYNNILIDLYYQNIP